MYYLYVLFQEKTFLNIVLHVIVFTASMRKVTVTLFD